MSHSPDIIERSDDSMDDVVEVRNARSRLARRPRRHAALTVEEKRSVYNSEGGKAERNYHRMCRNATQGIVRCLIAVVTLGCLVASRLSFAVMIEQFSSNSSSVSVNDSVRVNDSRFKDSVRVSSLFWLLLLSILIPYAFSFVRCAWVSLQLLRIDQRIHYPWPSLSAKASLMK